MSKPNRRLRPIRLIVTLFLCCLITVSSIPLSVFASGESAEQAENDVNIVAESEGESKTAEKAEEQSGTGEKPESSTETKPDEKTEKEESSTIEKTEGSETKENSEIQSEESTVEKKENKADETPQKEYAEEISITTEEELRAFAARVNGGEALENVLVTIKNDIVINSGTPWIPIGNDVLKPFSGTLDGGRFTIKGVIVEKDAVGGLFGYILNAEVKNVVIANFVAPKSTAGIFYSAVTSNVEFTRGVEGKTTAPVSFRARYSAPVGWGTTTVANEVPMFHMQEEVYEITNPEQLEALAGLFNSGAVSGTYQYLETATYSLKNDLNLSGKDFTPIADGTGDSFSGRFVGNGKTISNMTINVTGAPLGTGFIGVTTDGNASVSGLRFTNASVTSDSDAVGTVVGLGEDVNISNIVVDTTEVNGGSVSGGVVGLWINGATTPSSMTQCVVIDATVNSTDFAGGIAGITENIVVSECVVYGSAITSDYVGGISGEHGNGPSITGNRSLYQNMLVMNTELNGTSGAAGIATAGGAANTKSGKNVIISGVTSIGAAELVLGVDFDSGSGAPVLSLENFFTDSPLTSSFVPDSVNTSIAVWDSVAPVHLDDSSVPAPEADKNGNGPKSTATLTDGWAPSPEWIASTDRGLYYPQIRALAESSIPEIREISALASIAPIPTGLGEVYTDPTNAPKTVKLPKATSNGVNITWAGYTGAKLLSDTATEKFHTLYREDNGQAIFDLTATVGGRFFKTFPNFNISDRVLKEDINSPDSRLKSGLTILPERAITLRFFDDIIVNPDVAGIARLYIIRDNGEEVLDQAIPCVLTPGKFDIDSSNKLLTLGFALKEGTDYRIDLPVGTVMESYMGVPVSNFSDKMDVKFSTIAFNAPVVMFNNPSIERFATQVITKEELLAEAKVYAFSGDPAPFYDGSVNPNQIAQYSGSLWDEDNIDGSIKNILADTSILPNGVNSAVYCIEDATNLLHSNGPVAGRYSISVLAKNERGITNSNTMTIIVQGAPTWKGAAPKDTVHIYKTKDIATVISAAKQGAIAAVRQKDGTDLPVIVKADYSVAEWDRIADNDVSSKLEVEVYAAGASSADPTSPYMKVTVYMDTPLQWSLNPSPVTMNLSTNRQVEERVGFMARNFNSNILEYNHWENDYRKPGLYYVDIESKSQHVTLCQDKSCNSTGVHPKDQVDDTFIINMVYPPGKDLLNEWGRVTSEVVGESYSQEAITVMPTSYTMPSFIPEALLKQNFGRMELSYNNEYRWGLYSNTLDTTHRWNDSYNMEAAVVNDKAVNNLLTSTDSAVQLRFGQSGKLVGLVEFDLNLDIARADYKNLPKENLGLYRYNSATSSLDLISDVIVKDGQWASATLTEIYPSTYVLKARDSKDSVVEYSAEYFETFYLNTKNINDFGQGQDGAPLLVKRPTNPDVLTGIASGELKDSIYGVNVTDVNSSPVKISAVWPIIITAVVLLGVIGFFLYRAFTKKERV